MDRIKEEIGYLKLLFGIIAALNTGLISWIFTNGMSAPTLAKVGGFIVGGLSTGLVYLHTSISNKIRRL